MSHVEPVPGGTSESSPASRPRRGRPPLLSLAILAVTFTQGAVGKDLIGVYDDALRSDPQLRAADANRLASRESRPQAIAALLPQVTGTAAYTRDHNGGNQDQLGYTPPPNVTPYAAPLPYTAGTGEKQWELNLRQNLF